MDAGFNAAQWLVGAEPALLEEISKQYEKATNHVDFFQCRGLCFDKVGGYEATSPRREHAAGTSRLGCPCCCAAYATV
jgi:hypothetical protein